MRREPPEGEAPALERLVVRRGGVAYNTQVVLSGLHINWTRGRLHLLYGVAGAGKSTLLRALSGANRHIPALRRWGDWLANDLPFDAQPDLPVLLHQRLSSSGARVGDELASTLADRGSLTLSAQRERVEAVLAPYGLDGIIALWQEPVFQLPLELRRVFSLARALSVRPAALLADELTADVSDGVREQLRAALLRAARERVVVLATHDRRCLGWADTEAWSLKAKPADLPPTLPVIDGCEDAGYPTALRARAPRGLVWVLPRRLGGMPRPGMLDPLETTARMLHDLQVSRLVCLEEVLPYPEHVFVAQGVAIRHFPIPDMGVPALLGDFLALIDDLRAEMALGRTIVVHCRGGLGRTGLVLAALVAAQRQVSTREALDAIRRHEPRFVQSEAQWAYLAALDTLPRSA